MPFLKIVKPGFFTTIQDLGRFGYLKSGMPAAGAMDEYALRVGNILVGNRENEACLELTYVGPTVEFLADGLVGLSGADLGAQLNGAPLGSWRSFAVHAGDILSFGPVKNGCRAYLAIAGGLKIPAVMGSKSTYLLAKIGGLDGRALLDGDVLERAAEAEKRRQASLVPGEYIRVQAGSQEVRVIMGPQDDAFSDEGIAAFLGSEYRITHDSDRMGCRFDGPQIKHRRGADIVSDGVAFGSIQVPGNGLPIVMMADRQTTGGYTKIATVVTADLWKLAQARTGDVFRFSAVPLEAARAIYLAYEQALAELPGKFLPLRPEAPTDLAGETAQAAAEADIAGGKGPQRVLSVRIGAKEYRVEVSALETEQQ